MAKHKCYECRHMKYITDERSRMYYFCMYSESPCFMEEVGVCGECDLDGYAEVRYNEIEELNNQCFYR